MNPVWVGETVVLAMHERLLAEHGGAQGLRDAAMLDSALARPRQLYAYGDPDVCDLATAYAAGIVRDHPFVDGNKRVAFMTTYVFLARNGQRLVASEVDAAQIVSALAAREIDEAEFAKWLREKCEAE